jgi:site-specific DNA-cytosine methylase
VKALVLGLVPYFAKSGLYEIRWFSLRVNQLRGAHRRERVFILGKLANSKSIYARRTKNNHKRTDNRIISNSTENGKQDRQNQTNFCCTDDGFPVELARDLMTPLEARANIDSSIKQLSEWEVNDNQRLKALGNAVTPQQAYVALKVLDFWLKSV